MLSQHPHPRQVHSRMNQLEHRCRSYRFMWTHSPGGVKFCFKRCLSLLPAYHDAAAVRSMLSKIGTNRGAGLTGIVNAPHKALRAVGTDRSKVSKSRAMSGKTTSTCPSSLSPGKCSRCSSSTRQYSSLALAYWTADQKGLARWLFGTVTPHVGTKIAPDAPIRLRLCSAVTHLSRSVGSGAGFRRLVCETSSDTTQGGASSMRSTLRTSTSWRSTVYSRRMSAPSAYTAAPCVCRWGLNGRAGIDMASTTWSYIRMLSLEARRCDRGLGGMSERFERVDGDFYRRRPAGGLPASLQESNRNCSLCGVRATPLSSRCTSTGNGVLTM